MNYGLANCALSSYISASKGVKVFLLLQFRIELSGEEYQSKKHFQEKSVELQIPRLRSG